MRMIITIISFGIAAGCALTPNTEQATGDPSSAEPDQLLSGQFLGPRDYSIALPAPCSCPPSIYPPVPPPSYPPGPPPSYPPGPPPNLPPSPPVHPPPPNYTPGLPPNSPPSGSYPGIPPNGYPSITPPVSGYPLMPPLPPVVVCQISDGQVQNPTGECVSITPMVTPRSQRRKG